MNIYEIGMSCAFGILVFYLLKGNKSGIPYGVLVGIAGFAGHQQGYLTDDFSIPLFVGIVVGMPVLLLILSALFSRESQ